MYITLEKILEFIPPCVTIAVYDEDTSDFICYCSATYDEPIFALDIADAFVCSIEPTGDDVLYVGISKWSWKH